MDSEDEIRRRICILDRLGQYEEALYLVYRWRAVIGSFRAPSPLSTKCQEWAVVHGEQARAVWESANAPDYRQWAREE